ncbi:MAG: SDR family NAD(P)-dependent oxidoreductase [Atopobiaceae bacterium]
MGKLDGKVCVITGCGSGLGKQFAIRMAREGAKLSLVSHNAERLEDTRRQCEEAGADAIAYACDVADKSELEKFVKMTIDHFGTVDVLVNNVHHTVLAPFIDLKMEDFMYDLKVDFCSTWYLMQMFFPYMRDKPGAGASIINFGSRWGQESPKLAGEYSPLKESIRALSRVVAREWGQYNIRCNIVCPGGFTDNAKAHMNEQLPELQKFAMEQFSNNAFNRPGDPYSDVAPVVVFLASDDSKWLSGQTINVDGGGWMAD